MLRRRRYVVSLCKLRDALLSSSWFFCCPPVRFLVWSQDQMSGAHDAPSLLLGGHFPVHKTPIYISPLSILVGLAHMVWSRDVHLLSAYFPSLCLFHFLVSALVPTRVTEPNRHYIRFAFSLLLLTFIIKNTVRALHISPLGLVSQSVCLTTTLLICVSFCLYFSCVLRLFLSLYAPG